MYRRNHLQGRHKIQDIWNTTIHEVLECLDGVGTLYKVRPLGEQGPGKVLHRAELKPAPCRLEDYPSAVRPVVTPQPPMTAARCPGALAPAGSPTPTEPEDDVWAVAVTPPSLFPFHGNVSPANTRAVPSCPPHFNSMRPPPLSGEQALTQPDDGPSTSPVVFDAAQTENGSDPTSNVAPFDGPSGVS